MMNNGYQVALVGALLAALMASLGCNQPASQGPKAAPGPRRSEATPNSGGKHFYAGRDWCAEHGVPESECAQCNPRLAAQLKEGGDWCKEHDVPDSQCFTCHPELKAKFAAAYKVKYGEEPPPIEELDKDQSAKKRN
jgi:cobalt-zinc-cadmium efflux system membrane fusion protein